MWLARSLLARREAPRHVCVAGVYLINRVQWRHVYVMSSVFLEKLGKKCFLFILLRNKKL